MRLLRVYPAAWRARYGDELAALIETVDGGTRMSMRTRVDVLRGGVVERARALRLDGLPPDERAREGSLRVLYAWTIFVVGGIGVQKASEYWQAATPVGKQGLPAAAFDVLVVAAGVGSLFVLLGIALALPAVLGLLRDGGWQAIRRPVIRAAFLALLVVVAFAGLRSWAHSLTQTQRNGGDPAYDWTVVGVAVVFALCLLALTAAAAATARRLTLSSRLLRIEALLGAAVCGTMIVMTVAAAVWWAAIAQAAPWFLAGRPVGESTSALSPNLIVPLALMLGATTLGLAGARRAVLVRR